MLEDRDFRMLLYGQLAAQAGDGLGQATLAKVLILDPLSQGTPARILAVFAVTLLPYSLAGPFLGVFVDRWPRRGVMVWTNALRFAVMLALPVVHEIFPGQFALYATALLLLSFGRLFLATKGAVLPVLLHEHHLIGGNSLSSGVGMISTLLGGAIGIFGADAVGFNVSIWIAGAVYGAAALLLMQISRPLDHRHARAESVSAALARVGGELADGLRAIWERRRARLALIAIFVLRTIGMFVVVAAILVIKTVFPGRLQDLGRVSTSALALGAAGAGAFIGATLAPLFARRLDKAGLVILGYVVSAAAIVSLGGIVNIVAVVFLTFLGGVGGFITKVAVDAQIQEALPDELRGRAFALYDILYNLASVAAAGVMVAATDIALRPRLIGAGLAAALAAALIGRAMSRAGMPLSLSSERVSARAS